MKIEFKDFSVSFKDKKLFNKINAQVNGDNIWVWATNGRGKTTIFNCIYGLDQYEGDILIDDRLIDKNRGLLANKEFAYSYQKPTMIMKATILQNLKLLDIDQEVFTLYIKQFHFEPSYNKKVMNLSGGEQQIVNICLALSIPSKIILLDEPTNNLSDNNINNLVNVLKNEKRGIIYSSHHEIPINYTKIDISGWRLNDQSTIII